MANLFYFVAKEMKKYVKLFKNIEIKPMIITKIENFLFNGRDLNNNNSSLIDNGINNGSLIKVIFQKEFNANN